MADLICWAPDNYSSKTRSRKYWKQKTCRIRYGTEKLCLLLPKLLNDLLDHGISIADLAMIELRTFFIE